MEHTSNLKTTASVLLLIDIILALNFAILNFACPIFRDFENKKLQIFVTIKYKASKAVFKTLRIVLRNFAQTVQGSLAAHTDHISGLSFRGVIKCIKHMCGGFNYKEVST